MTFNVRFLTARWQSSALSPSNTGSEGNSAGRFASDNVSRDTLVWVVLAQGFAILPLFFYLPIWLAAFWAIAIVIRVQIFRGVWPFQGNIIKFFFGVVGGLGLYWSFGGRMGVEPMIGFLLLSFVLKLIEIRSRVDVLIILYIGFVIVACQLLLSQTFWMSLYSVMSVCFLLAALQAVFQHRRLSFRRQLSSGFLILLQSLPIMLILFLAMPRLGQLWAVPSLSGSGKTGFSDSMSPGDLSSLIQSDDIVFRATFKNDNIPDNHQRYWRGLVLEQFDGRKWHRYGAEWVRIPVDSGALDANSPHPKWNVKTKNNAVNDVFHYSVLLEPHNYKWLFSLRVPIEAHSSASRPVFNEQVLLLSRTPISAKTLYEVVSDTNVIVGPLKEEGSRELIRNIELPSEGNAQARELSKSWLEKGLSPEQIIKQAQGLFNKDFTYTLRPPLLGENSIDDFLFKTQRGFCEHFSSSFVFLMRAAGIPARVVVGYQGGEYRERGRYIIVRQSEAHAWAEVWLEGQGWVRVDPTASVSPARIENALHEVVDSGESSLVGGALLRVKALMWLANVRNTLEEWDYLWQSRVLSYDDDSQQDLLQALLGGADPWRSALFFIGGVGACLALYYVWGSLAFRREKQALELRLLLGVFDKLEALGFKRLPQETPKAFADRVGRERQDLKPALNRLVGLYYRLCYQPAADRSKTLANNMAQPKRETLLLQLKKCSQQFG